MNLGRSDKCARSPPSDYAAISFQLRKSVPRCHKADAVDPCKLSLRVYRVPRLQVSALNPLEDGSLDLLIRGNGAFVMVSTHAVLRNEPVRLPGYAPNPSRDVTIIGQTAIAQ